MSIIMDRINQEIEHFREYDVESGKKRTKKISYADVAEKLAFSPSALSRLKKGEHIPTESTINHLANTFKVRREYLLCLDNFRTVEDYDNHHECMKKTILMFREVLAHLGYYDALDDGNIIVKPDSLSYEDFYRLIQIKCNCTIHSDYIIARKDPAFQYIYLNPDEFNQIIENITDYIQFTIENLFKRRSSGEIHSIELDKILIEMAKGADSES